MRKTFALLAAAAIALSLTGAGGAIAAGKDDGPPYTADPAMHGCRDVHNHVVPAAKCAVVPAKKAPNCTKGKLCGDSCIAKEKVCHK